MGPARDVVAAFVERSGARLRRALVALLAADVGLRCPRVPHHAGLAAHR